jgi:hypothetical protein
LDVQNIQSDIPESFNCNKQVLNEIQNQINLTFEKTKYEKTTVNRKTEKPVSTTQLEQNEEEEEGSYNRKKSI